MAKTFWEDLSTYCDHLAPVIGPLVSSVGNAAAAMDRAERQAQGLEARMAVYSSLPICEDPDQHVDRY